MATRVIAVDDVGRTTEAEACRLLAAGYRSHAAIEVGSLGTDAAVLRALAAARIGLLLTQQPASTPAPGDTIPDLDVVETGMWSQTPLLEVSSVPTRCVTHGQFLAAAVDRVSYDGWETLGRVVRDLLQLGAAPTRQVRNTIIT